VLAPCCPEHSAGITCYALRWCEMKRKEKKRKEKKRKEKKRKEKKKKKKRKKKGVHLLASI